MNIRKSNTENVIDMRFKSKPVFASHDHGTGTRQHHDICSGTRKFVQKLTLDTETTVMVVPGTVLHSQMEIAVSGNSQS